MGKLLDRPRIEQEGEGEYKLRLYTEAVHRMSIDSMYHIYVMEQDASQEKLIPDQTIS
jgi:hypothetical protein